LQRKVRELGVVRHEEEPRPGTVPLERSVLDLRSVRADLLSHVHAHRDTLDPHAVVIHDLDRERPTKLQGGHGLLNLIGDLRIDLNVALGDPVRGYLNHATGIVGDGRARQHGIGRIGLVLHSRHVPVEPQPLGAVPEDAQPARSDVGLDLVHTQLLENGRVDLQRGHAQRLDGNPGEREHAALGRDGRPEADCVRGFCALDGCHARREVQRGGLSRGRQELQADRHIRLAEAAHHRLQFRDETGDGRDRLIAEGDRRQGLVVHQHRDLLPFLDQSQRLNVLV